ncbi:hypothetical protein BVRB_8g191030 [Beta vulgaris subsp. vulgaris]|nr:hypothetical protein BVRB_8g191030 [Beta vulgaris subsp. vulgaris]
MEVPWLFLALFIFSLSILLKLVKRHSTPAKLPPGPPKLPLLGNLHQLAWTATVPHRRLAELASIYGPIMHLRLGEVSTVVITSAELAKEVMKTHDTVFCDRPQIMVAKEFFYDSTDIGLAPYGQYWRQVRKIAVLELFTAKRVESFRPIREEEVANLMEFLKSEEGSVVNLSKKLFGLIFNIMSRLALSRKGKEQEEFQALTVAVSTLAAGFSAADFYPSAKLFHSIIGTKKKYKELVKEANRILDPIIDDRKAKKKDNDHGNKDEEDLVDVLLKFHKDKNNLKNPHGDFSLSLDNIKAVVLVSATPFI